MRENVFGRTLISIIVPVYNVESYIKRCIDSILKQTYKEIEIILVDDGSTDGSGKICRIYSEQYENVKVLTKPNGGLAEARNSGLAVATGKYVGFIDSDDWVEPNMYEQLINLIEQKNCKIAMCKMTIHNGDKEIKDINLLKCNNVSMNSLQVIDVLLEGKIEPSVCNKLFLRELFKDISFPIGKISEDWFVIYKLLYEAQKIAYTFDTAYYYFVNQNSITRSGRYNIRTDAIQAFDEMGNYLGVKYPDHIFSKKVYDQYYQYYLVNCIKANCRNIHIYGPIVRYTRMNIKRYISNCESFRGKIKIYICSYFYTLSRFVFNVLKKLNKKL